MADVDGDQPIYGPLLQFGAAYQNDNSKALDELEVYYEAKDDHFWVLYLPNEPYLQDIIDIPRFKAIMKTLGCKFWQQHEEIKESLEAEGLI